MASYPTAEDEKRLLADATETTAAAAAVDMDTDTRKTRCRRSCRRRMAGVKRAAHFTVTLMFVIACGVAVFCLSSLAIGTMRHAPSCDRHGNPVNGAKSGPVVVVEAGGPAGAGEASSPQGGFSRLLEAVSPESLHDLLHQYFPDTYKHGVYPSEKKALEAIHRANAALATSIVQLARRDLNNGTTSRSSQSSPPPSSTPPPTSSSTPPPTSSKPTSSSPPTSSKKNTSHTTSKSSSNSETQTTGSKKVTTYTSTINGTPTVITSTSIVGVGAGHTGGSPSNSGSLQTGAAVPMLGGSHNKARLAEAVAGVVVGAMLI